jgi:flavin-binding protein dodecin
MAKSFEIVEKVGVSTKCYCEAIEELVNEVGKKHKISWFEVKEQRGRVDDKGKIEYQVTLKFGLKG